MRRRLPSGVVTLLRIGHVPRRLAICTRLSPCFPRLNSGQALRKRVRNVAGLSADIEGCTRLCEDLPPREMNRVSSSVSCVVVRSIANVKWLRMLA